ncbi:gcn5-related n-acetyltransferase [Colletotrichum falcatum]|nr:gcn5-related n-acetyltransferase [Colletotrichum falcatum]
MASQDSARNTLEIVTPRLIIRTAVPSDAKAYLGYLTTPANFPFQEPEKDLTMDRIRARIDDFAESTARGENGWIVIVLRDTGELIGNGGYNTFEPVDAAGFLLPGTATLPPGERRMTDLGVGINHRHWRRGYALEALEALVEHARASLGCEVFRVETGDDNGPLRSLMRTAGLGGLESRHRASYDASQEVWAWKFDAGHWARSTAKLKGEGKWFV